MSKKNKSRFQILAEAMASADGLGSLKVSNEHLNKRKLTIDEIKELIREGFGKAKDVSDTKAKEDEKGWGNADVENQIDWVDTLKLKEYFDTQKSDDDDDDESDESDESDTKEKDSSDEE